MKVLQVGGEYTVTSTLAKYLLRNGLDVAVAGLPRGDRIFSEAGSDPDALRDALSGRYDIVQFNQRDSLRMLGEAGIAPSLDKSIAALRDTGSKLIYYSYGRDELNGLLSPDQDGKLWARASFDHVFLGSPDNHKLVSAYDRWSWQAIPVDLDMIGAPSQRAPKPQTLRALHISHKQAPEETSAIRRAALGVQEHMKFNFKSIDSGEISNVGAYYAALLECDLFIGRLGGESFDALAVEAMAHGKPVMSHLPALSKTIWPELAMSPVLDIDQRTIHRQLEAVVRQPICLRDLIVRSRAFAETYHNASVIVARMVHTYQRLLN